MLGFFSWFPSTSPSPPGVAPRRGVITAEDLIRARARLKPMQRVERKAAPPLLAEILLAARAKLKAAVWRGRKKMVGMMMRSRKNA